MAAYIKFFPGGGGRSYRFSGINTLTEVNELHHSQVNGARFKLKYVAKS